MIRQVLRADGTAEKIEVGNGFETWNKAIRAHTGTIVEGIINNTTKGTLDRVELWCDDEALCVAEPVYNFFASLIARQPIFGDVILFRKGDIK